MKKFRLIPAFLLSAALLSGLTGCKKETEYYVNMACAWLLAECFIKFRNETLHFLEQNTLNDFIVNKGIQKCRDSFRVSDEDKDLLLKFKRN